MSYIIINTDNREGRGVSRSVEVLSIFAIRFASIVYVNSIELQSITHYIFMPINYYIDFLLIAL